MAFFAIQSKSYATNYLPYSCTILEQQTKYSTSEKQLPPANKKIIHLSILEGGMKTIEYCYENAERSFDTFRQSRNIVRYLYSHSFALNIAIAKCVASIAITKLLFLFFYFFTFIPAIAISIGLVLFSI